MSLQLHVAPLSSTMCAPCPSHPGPPAGTGTANGVWCGMARWRDERTCLVRCLVHTTHDTTQVSACLRWLVAVTTQVANIACLARDRWRALLRATILQVDGHLVAPRLPLLIQQRRHVVVHVHPATQQTETMSTARLSTGRGGATRTAARSWRSRSAPRNARRRAAAQATKKTANTRSQALVPYDTVPLRIC